MIDDEKQKPVDGSDLADGEGAKAEVGESVEISRALHYAAFGPAAVLRPLVS